MHNMVHHKSRHKVQVLLVLLLILTLIIQGCARSVDDEGNERIATIYWSKYIPIEIDNSSGGLDNYKPGSEILRKGPGKEKETIISEPLEILGYTDIAISDHEEKMYWTTYEGRIINGERKDEGNARIWSSDMNGMNRELVVDYFPVQSFDSLELELNYERELLYWSTGAAFFRVPLNGGNIEHILQGVPISDFETTKDGNEVFWFNSDKMSIQRTNLNDGTTTPVITGIECLPDLELDALHQKVYWGDRHGIRRADFDGSNIEAVVKDQSYTDCKADQLELDERTKMLYLVNFDKIMSYSIQEKDEEMLLDDGLILSLEILH